MFDGLNQFVSGGVAGAVGFKRSTLTNKPLMSRT